MAIDHRAKNITPKVAYEFKMMEWISDKIISDVRGADEYTKSMLLEVFLLHARILHDFFILDAKRDDDVSAVHFFDDPSVWVSKRDAICTKLKAEQVRLNKKLAHLTYKRLTEKEEWEIISLCNELRVAKQEFINSLADEQRQWFAQQEV